MNNHTIYFWSILTLILNLNLIKNTIACPFHTYQQAIINTGSQTWMQTLENDDTSNGGVFTFGFWTFNIPLLIQTDNLNIGEEFKINEPQTGELLFLLKNTETNGNLIVCYKSFDYVQQKVQHIFLLENGVGNFQFTFDFNSLQYEGIWIFHLVVFENSKKKMIVKVNQQDAQSGQFSFQNQLNLEIIIGGKGYISNLNLNYFKGLQSKLIFKPSIDYSENISQDLMNECQIPQRTSLEQTIQIVQGLKLFEGNQVLQMLVDQYGNKYCIQGWVKYILTNLSDQKYTLLKLKGISNYEQEKTLGDELLKIEVFISSDTPKETQIIVNADAYGMPVQQSFQSQYDLFFQGQQNPDYNVLQTKKYYQDLNTQLYYEGLQQWHFIQYEYGRSNFDERMLLIIKFSNELGLLKDNLGNDIFSGSFTNSKFNLFFGGDNINNNINNNFLKAQIYNFKMQYNYNQDKPFNIDCHYTCLTCFGPLEQNCLSCDPNSNRYYQNELKICQCFSGYLEQGNFKCNNQFYFSIVQEEVEIDIDIQCPFGYFQLPDQKGNGYDCLECPSLKRTSSIYCVDCLFYPKIWYLKPVCKEDYKQNFEKYDDESLVIKQRIPTQNDVYLIGNNKQIIQYSEYEDYCQYSLDKNNYCHKVSHFHLGSQPTLKCKYNYLYDMVKQVCLRSNLICKTYDIQGHCIDCLTGMYLVWYYCNQCPNTCTVCQNNGQNQAICLECIEQYTIKNGACFKCGNDCKICKDIYDENLGYSYLKCLKCIDDFRYLISLDGINCILNDILHCEHAFQTLDKDYTINSLDINFTPQLDQSKFKLLCAKCQQNYIYVFENQQCVQYVNTEQCEIGIGQYKNSDQILDLVQCLKSDKYENEVVEFIQNCRSYVNYCKVCLETNIQNYFHCLECEDGYYAEQLSGQCIQCPIELNCIQCYQQNSISKDYWKKDVRAFYRKYIEVTNTHQYILNAISQNINDYELICLECQNGYRAYQNKCIKFCSDSCVECLFKDDQYHCIRCQNDQKGRRQSINNNECIECPENCQLCRPRTPQEIEEINPLFNNTKYQKYSSQCIKSYEDQNYYYDQDLGLFVECQQTPNRHGCYKQLIIELNLYSDQFTYFDDFNRLKDEESRIEFKKRNTYFKDFNSFDFLFSEFENDEFYTLANMKQIKSIILKIVSVSEIHTTITGILSQKFCNNIFSVINVELILDMPQGSIITIKELLQFSNFNKITLINIIFDTCVPCYQQIKIIFESVFPQIISFNQITIQQILEPQYFDYLKIQFKNIKQLFANGLQFISFGQRNVDQFFTISGSKTIKQIIFKDLQIKNCQFQNSIIFSLELLENDLVEFDNVTILNSQFNNITFIQVETLNPVGSLVLKNIEITSIISESNSFFSLQLFKEMEIMNFSLIQSIITNSKILILTNVALLNNLIFLSNTFINRCFGIININQLSHLDYDYQFKNIQFENNTYNNIIKFIEFNKYQSSKQKIIIQEINLIDNYLTDESLEYNQQQDDSSLVLITFDEILIINFIINRGFGLVEFSFLETKVLQITNGKILQNKFQFLGLHKNLNCQLKQVKGQLYPSSINIGSFYNASFFNVTILQSQAYNFPIIKIQSASLSQRKIQQNLILINIIFQSNLLLVSKIKFSPSLIQINSLQESLIEIKNLIFQLNVLNEYIQDHLEKQTGLLLINCPNCQILLMNSIFDNNILTNSRGTILSIITQSLEVRNCSFESNNVLNYDVIQPYLIWGFSQSVTYKAIEKIFQIKSISGIGLIWVQSLNILNSSFQNAVGQFGGCFSIFAQGSSRILIENSSFYNLSTQFYQEIEQGGVIYIEGSSATALKIDIKNIKVQNIYCRQYGGFLYLKSNNSQTNLTISDIILRDIYAQQGSIMFISYSRLVQYPQTLFISKLEIKNSQQSYFKFLNKFTTIANEFEKQYLINNRSLIFVEYGSSITLQNISSYYLIQESFLNLQNTRNIYMDTINIQNSYLSNQLISINPFSFNNVTIRLRNFKIELINVGFEFINVTCTNLISDVNDVFYDCPQDTQTAPNLLQQDNENNESIGQCLYISLQTQLDISNSGLMIFKYSSLQCQLEMYEVLLKYIICKQCNQGLISLQLQDQNLQQSKVQQLNNIKVLNSNCGQKGCIIVEKISLLSGRNLNEIQFKFLYDLQISNYYCTQNLGRDGTCLYLNQIKTQILISNFQSNNASNNGGALYILGDEPLLIENCMISDNRAIIGGGMYLQDQLPMNYIKTNTIIVKNQAIQYGNNIASIPERLSIRLKGELPILNTISNVLNSTMQIEEIMIQPYHLINGQYSKYVKLPTGQSISKYQFFDQKNQIFINDNLIFRIQTLSRDMKINLYPSIETSLCTIQSRQYNISKKDEDQLFTNNYTNVNQIKFNTDTQDYNLDELIVYFNNEAEDEIVLQLQFSCEAIKVPIFDSQYPYFVENQHQNYKLRINVKTFECQFGEIKNITNFACEQCDSTQGLFSLTLNAQKCDIKNDISSIAVYKNQIQLRSGYWRPYFHTKLISYCMNLPMNCNGGWNVGDKSCYTGHLGALCEQCDLYNIRGEGSFSLSEKYICGTCLDKGKNIMMIIGVIIMTMIFIFISVSGNIKTVEQHTRAQPFKNMRISNYLNKAQSGILIKMLTNYLQIIVTITTFQLNFPQELNSTISAVGNPLQTVTHSLDCFLVDLINVEIQYSRMIWQIIMPFLYINFFLGFYLIVAHFKLASYNSSVPTTALIYGYLYFSPNLTDGLVQLVSYREISGFKWIQANVSERYDTIMHLKWMIYFCLPFLLILGILIPFYLFYGLYKCRRVQDQKSTRLHWGYLYHEYKEEAYFWELIKIFQKELIILSLIYYEDSIAVKGILVLFITYLYQELNSNYRPYKLSSLNNLDYYSANICMITISLAIGAYLSQSSVSELQALFFIMMAFFNFIFLYKIITKIIAEYSKTYQFLLDKLKELLKSKLPILQNSRYFKNMLKNKAQERQRVQRAFKKLRVFGIPLAKRIIELKNQSIENYKRFKIGQVIDSQGHLRMDSKIDLQELDRVTMQRFLQSSHY
ncbi:unnamed protein product [Paramecium primaurelia]|uniref:Uncharacterized protein n=1 Tax=Paramecium primaurelia TaxID=5886 RepID=A0A8S1Q9Q0_PARPR|nr:unnamed protein product [Paramecium primaurelia]